jgi:hypothetical protein
MAAGAQDRNLRITVDPIVVASGLDSIFHMVIHCTSFVSTGSFRFRNRLLLSVFGKVIGVTVERANLWALLAICFLLDKLVVTRLAT